MCPYTLPKQARYQLRYTPKKYCNCILSSHTLKKGKNKSTSDRLISTLHHTIGTCYSDAENSADVIKPKRYTPHKRCVTVTNKKFMRSLRNNGSFRIVNADNEA